MIKFYSAIVRKHNIGMNYKKWWCKYLWILMK